MKMSMGFRLTVAIVGAVLIMLFLWASAGPMPAEVRAYSDGEIAGGMTYCAGIVVVAILGMLTILNYAGGHGIR